MKTCSYCGTDDQDKNRKSCIACGATLSEPFDIHKSGPSFYRGYLVYFIHEFLSDCYEVQFYLGERLVERIKITREALREFVKEGDECMPFFYGLLQVSQGEIETLRVETMNGKEPTAFEIRRLDTPREQDVFRLRGLDRHQLYDALKSGA